MQDGQRILIAGCGYVGGRLAGELVAKGDRVYGLRRNTDRLPSGARPVQADLSDPGTLQSLPRALDAVVYTASPSDHDEAGYRRAYLDGLSNLIDALAGRQPPPRRLVFTSSTAVYGQSGGEWVDEDSPTAPRSYAGRILLEAESLVRDAAIPGCTLRLGGIYGPSRTRLMEQMRSGRARRRPGPPHYTNRIHRDDAAGALRHLLALDRVAPVYLGVDGSPGEEGEVLRFLADLLGVPEPPLAGSEESLPPHRAGSKRCRNDRLTTSGYRFHYPSFREGYTALLHGLERDRSDR